MKASLDPRTFTIATYALCGFANFGSIGIQIGGIGALAPERRNDLARLGVRALVAGTLANFMTRLHRGRCCCDAASRRLEEAAALVRARTPCVRPIGVVLGSGLGAFADALERADERSPTARSRTSPPRPPSGIAASSCSAAPAPCRWP